MGRGTGDRGGYIPPIPSPIPFPRPARGALPPRYQLPAFSMLNRKSGVVKQSLFCARTTRHATSKQSPRRRDPLPRVMSRGGASVGDSGPSPVEVDSRRARLGGPDLDRKARRPESAYIRDGRLQWTRVYGEQSKGVPATPGTLFNVASLTKPVFAELILRLAADGRLSLDEPLYAHWVDPDLAGDPRHRLLTPRMVLSHRTGFPNWRHETKDTLRFQSEPGAKYRYSGEGFEYLARFVERKFSSSLDSLAAEYVFRPLGMKNTSFTRKTWFDGRIALPNGPKGAVANPSFSVNGNAADDAYATIEDYATFVVAVMNRTGLTTSLARQRDSLHSEDSGGLPPCALVTRCWTRAGYGLGWSILEYPSGQVLWHTGSDWGEKSMVFYFPETREGAVLFTNSADGFQPIIDAAVLLFPESEFAELLRSGKQ